MAWFVNWAMIAPDRGQTTTHKLLRDSRHALAEVFGGQKIGFGWRNVRPGIVVRLCRGTEPEAQPIEVLLRAVRIVVAWRQTEIDPVHAMLCREDGELGQRCELVPGP